MKGCSTCKHKQKEFEEYPCVVCEKHGDCVPSCYEPKDSIPAESEKPVSPCEDMTLRDMLAVESIATAFEMETRNPTYNCDGCASYQGVAERAYLLADAMLKAREQK